MRLIDRCRFGLCETLPATWRMAGRTIRGASGYLVFLVGEGLILSGAAMDLVASAPSFTAGVLPFFAYPFLAATLFGWAWVHYKHGAADDRRASS